MMENHVVRKSITIKAKPEQVWDALTNPEKTKRYFFKTKVYSDWKQGSPITFKGKLFYLLNFEMSGVILDIDYPKLLKYNLKNAKSSSISTVTDRLSFENGMTSLSIIDDVGQGEGAGKRFKRSEKGWSKILGGLKDLLESESKNPR